MSAEQMYGTSLKGMRTVLKETLLELGRMNGRVVVIDCETGTATNIMAYGESFPDRFIKLGIAEQNAVSFSFGLARSGLIPIIPLFASFLTRRACDQIFIQVGYSFENIKLIGCYAGLTTSNTGATHQSVNDIAIMRSIPGIAILEACDESELRQAIISGVQYMGPVYIRIAKSDIEPYNRRLTPVDYKFEIGKALVIKEGSDVSLIGSGIMVSRCLEAAKILKQKGIDAEVINCSTIKPIDRETILTSLKKTKHAVTAENHSIIGGIGSALSEFLIEEYPIPLRRVGIRDQFGQSGAFEDLLDEYHLTSEAIIDASLIVLSKQG
jgi:transketolase